MDPPPAEALIIALEQLYALGALNHLGELTKVSVLTYKWTLLEYHVCLEPMPTPCNSNLCLLTFQLVIFIIFL